MRGIVDPVGRVGSQLEMQAHLITGSRSVLHNIENAIETAKYQPLGEEVDVLATGARPAHAGRNATRASCSSTSAALATNWAVFRKGAMWPTAWCPWAATT